MDTEQDAASADTLADTLPAETSTPTRKRARPALSGTPGNKRKISRFAVTEPVSAEHVAGWVQYIEAWADLDADKPGLDEVCRDAMEVSASIEGASKEQGAGPQFLRNIYAYLASLFSPVDPQHPRPLLTHDEANAVRFLFAKLHRTVMSDGGAYQELAKSVVEQMQTEPPLTELRAIAARQAQAEQAMKKKKKKEVAKSRERDEAKGESAADSAMVKADDVEEGEEEQVEEEEEEEDTEGAVSLPALKELQSGSTSAESDGALLFTLVGNHPAPNPLKITGSFLNAVTSISTPKQRKSRKQGAGRPEKIKAPKKARKTKGAAKTEPETEAEEEAADSDDDLATAAQAPAAMTITLPSESYHL